MNLTILTEYQRLQWKIRDGELYFTVWTPVDGRGALSINVGPCLTEF